MSFTVDAVPLPDGFTDVFASRLVPVGDLTLHAVTGGTGPPLLLLPGWPQFWYGWRLMMPALAERFTVVAADLRGTGASDKPDTGYDLPTLADDMAALMDALGHDRYAVAGFDLGMLVGFTLAVRHPDRVTALVLSEALLPGADIGPMIAAPELNELMWHIPFNRAESVNERMVAGREEIYFGHQFTSKAGRPDAVPQYAVDTYVAALRDPAALHASFEFFRRGVGLPFRDVTLSAPVLAVGAERSVGPLVAELVRRHTDDVEELVVPGVGHFVPEEAPEAFTAAMLAFLDRTIAGVSEPQPPSDQTARAFDALGLDYEHAFRDLPPLDAALDRLLAALPPGSRVLDVGSGTGRPVAERLVAAGHHVTGIDVSPRMVEIAREQVPGAVFEPADVRTWSSPPGSWDAICAFFPLLTMPRPELDATLARLAGWLAPGGRLALATVPVDVDGVDGRFLGQPVRVYSYSAETFLARLRATGLTVDRHELATFQPDFPGADPEPHLYVDARR